MFGTVCFETISLVVQPLKIVTNFFAGSVILDHIQPSPTVQQYLSKKSVLSFQLYILSYSESRIQILFLYKKNEPDQQH